MRVECERCHALVVADFEVDPDGVTVSCGACGGVFRAEARRRPAPAVPDAGPGCVKCGAPMTDDPACPRCGLARDRARAWAAAEP
ncbi:MAG TPA: MJ0042-type zinc finger domain-containing protein, partial [Kofleriaceae bacterium]|nr:MJ0042-type zinc finger domain-containing protein [Kofleriaceae bacterium]